MLSITDLAMRVGYTRQTVSKIIREYGVPAVKRGNKFLIEASAFYAVLPQHKAAVLEHRRTAKSRKGDNTVKRIVSVYERRIQALSSRVRELEEMNRKLLEGR